MAAVSGRIGRLPSEYSARCAVGLHAGHQHVGQEQSVATCFGLFGGPSSEGGSSRYDSVQQCDLTETDTGHDGLESTQVDLRSKTTCSPNQYGSSWLFSMFAWMLKSLLDCFPLDLPPRKMALFSKRSASPQQN